MRHYPKGRSRFSYCSDMNQFQEATMSRSLLVPLDGSAFAEQALPLALALARHTDTTITLATVRPNFPVDGQQESAYLEELSRRITKATDARITRAVLTDDMRALDPSPPAAAITAELLMQHAAANSCDLVVMATHGRGGVRRAWLGSVADALIRNAICPIVMVRPQDEEFTIAASSDRGFKHIIVALDGSESSEKVLKYAELVGAPFGAHLTLVRVTSPLAWHATGVYSVVAAAPPLSHEAIRDYLELIAGGLRQFGLSVSTEVLEGGSPADAIVQYAHAHGADLIALATSGAGGVERLLLGSVADKVIRSSPVPTLICNTRHVADSGIVVPAGAAAGVLRPNPPEST
jgi:nucleotide-binding universal stress UspA family protein